MHAWLKYAVDVRPNEIRALWLGFLFHFLILTGYYIVRPDSPLFRQLGLYEAPLIDTADSLRHGYGADALAFRFNRNGVLIAPPAYIAQELPYDFYMRRIGSLTRGRATVAAVEALFGRSHRHAHPDLPMAQKRHGHSHSHDYRLFFLH